MVRVQSGKLKGPGVCREYIQIITALFTNLNKEETVKKTIQHKKIEKRIKEEGW